MHKKKWIWIIGSLILTAYSIKVTKMHRGYDAVGGEWLIPILIFSIYLLVSWIKKDIFQQQKSDNDKGKWINGNL
ncbi:MAG: hypothetical protein MJA31_09210 [Clostridia bacterium]|nr:hypothetical protein [Clostridia bacterium]